MIVLFILLYIHMAQKFKFHNNPTGVLNSPQHQVNNGNNTPGLRSSFQPSTSGTFQSFHYGQNDVILSPRGKNVPPSQNNSNNLNGNNGNNTNNFTNSMKQLESKLENVFSQLGTRTDQPQQQGVDLRTSMSNPVAKKIDKDYFRKTTFSPKPFLMFPQKNNEGINGSQSKNQEPTFNPILFNKKNFEILSQEKPQQQQFLQLQTGNNFKNKGLLNIQISPKNSQQSIHQSPYQQQQRKSLTKKSPIVCGFYFGRSLGSGKFGQVYLAKHVISGFVCAIKKIVKSKVKELNMLSQLIQQIKIQAFLSHPNIVQFYGVLSDQLHIYIVLQYMQGGTLFDYMADKQILNESQTIVYLREVAQAIKYIHDKDIAHRDLKPENIVISYNLVKLCDFGWAAKVSGSRKTYCGTFDYAPPQILERKQYDQTVDLWCLGILTYEMLTGKVPFEHKQRRMVMQKIVNVDKDKIFFPQTMSKNAKDFIESLIKKNPNQRIKSYRLLQHAFLRKNE